MRARSLTLVAVAAAAAAVALAACRAEAPLPIAVTFEEAALVAFGEMFRQYPDGADPFPNRVTGDVVSYEGRAAWKLDGDYAVTVDGQRRIDAWMLWIVAGEGGQPEIVRAEGPPDVGSR